MPPLESGRTEHGSTDSSFDQPGHHLRGAAERVDDGDELELDCATGILVNKTQGTALQGEALVEFILTMIAAGGLQPMILKRQNSPT